MKFHWEYILKDKKYDNADLHSPALKVNKTSLGFTSMLYYINHVIYIPCNKNRPFDCLYNWALSIFLLSQASLLWILQCM